MLSVIVFNSSVFFLSPFPFPPIITNVTLLVFNEKNNGKFCIRFGHDCDILRN